MFSLPKLFVFCLFRRFGFEGAVTGVSQGDLAEHWTNPIQSAQEVGPKFTTKARFGFQILLNYTGGALIFIRREQLCWKLKQISRTHCPLHVRHVSFAPGMPARSESVTGCHGHFLIRQDLSKQMCLCLGGFSRSVMRNPKVDPD